MSGQLFNEAKTALGKNKLEKLINKVREDCKLYQQKARTSNELAS